LTLIWRINLAQQAGYYTTFFHGRTDGTFSGDRSYWGAVPYPTSGTAEGTDHEWSIPAEGNDDTTDENANDTSITKGRWYVQAAQAYSNGGTSIIDFYWDLEAGTDRIISHQTSGGELTNTGNSPGLIFADAPWNDNDERLSGVLRGIQVYQAKLDLADIVLEAANHTSNTPKTAAGLAGVHYMNQNPTPDDITDKSGQGNDPAWANANRPSLWEP
jgi:hypothetical protein